MSTIRFSGDVSGFADVKAAANAGGASLTLPSVSGNLTASPVGSVVSNGSLMVGNTVSGVFDVSTLVQGLGSLITNDKGLITIATNVTSVVGRTGAVVLDTNDVAENAASNIWFTRARVRANVSATTPLSYNSGTGDFSHNDSGVVAAVYGTASLIPKITVDAKGHVTSVVNTAVTITSNGVIGSLTSDAALANTLGEFVSVNSPTGGSGTNGATGVFTDVASMALSPGDWDVQGTMELVCGGTPAVTVIAAGISTSAAAQDSVNKGGVALYAQSFGANQSYKFALGTRRISIAVGTTIRLVAAVTFAVASGTTYGVNSFMSARRVR